MKVLKKALPLLLTLLILLTGFLGLYFAAHTANLTKGHILYHQKSPQAGALYVAEGADILLSPWNSYAESLALDYFPTVQGKFQPYDGLSEEDWLSGAIAETVLRIYPDTEPIDVDVLLKALKYMEENSLVYLKDFTLQSKNGPSLLSLATDGKTLLYVNCVPQGRTAPTNDQLRRAESELTRLFSSGAAFPMPQSDAAEEATAFPTPQSDATEQVATFPPASALTDFAVRMDSLSGPLSMSWPEVLIADAYLFWTLAGRNCQRLLLDTQLLLVFEEEPLVLIYDPILEAFTGFSVQ